MKKIINGKVYDTQTAKYLGYYTNNQTSDLDQVDIRLYEDDRHEILNETDRAEVFEDLRTFFDNCLRDYQETYGVLPTDY